MLFVFRTIESKWASLTFPLPYLIATIALFFLSGTTLAVTIGGGGGGGSSSSWNISRSYSDADHQSGDCIGRPTGSRYFNVIGIGATVGSKSLDYIALDTQLDYGGMFRKRSGLRQASGPRSTISARITSSESCWSRLGKRVKSYTWHKGKVGTKSITDDTQQTITVNT